jgi:hypothetical protein
VGITARQFTPASAIRFAARPAERGRKRLFAVPQLDRRRYNNAVAAPAPSKPAAEEKHRHHRTVYAAEASGLLVIAILLLILALIRYWPYIPWGAR